MKIPDYITDYIIRHPGSGRAKTWREARKEERKRKLRTWNTERGDPLRRIYYGIIRRCHNPKDKGYHRYGGEGITVCQAWRDSFALFKAWALANDWKPGCHIHRTKKYGQYAPENCQILTAEAHMKLHKDWNTIYIKHLERQIKELRNQVALTQNGARIKA